MAIDKHIVRLAYQLLLGREVENEEIVEHLSSRYNSVYDLRNEFILSAEFQAHIQFMRFAEVLYSDEEKVRNRTAEFDTFLSSDEETEANIVRLLQSLIDDPQLHPAGKEYSIFHRTRFFDQIRAMVAIRRKLLGGHSRIRVLEVGTAPVTSYYGQVLPDMDFYTANIPSAQPSDQLAAQAKSLKHYDIDFESEDISVRYPEIVANPFHLILFCEVIEHIRAAPEELIADLLRVTASDGIIILSTPNALERGHLWELFNGRKPDTVYSKSKRFLHLDHHAHVREFTLKELETAVVNAGGRVVVQGVRDYYGDKADVVSARFVSARHVQTLLVARS